MRFRHGATRRSSALAHEHQRRTTGHELYVGEVLQMVSRDQRQANDVTGNDQEQKERYGRAAVKMDARPL
jgi:hypothetical protein